MLMTPEYMASVVQILSKIKICTTDFSIILDRKVTYIYPKIQSSLLWWYVTLLMVTKRA